jgi:hypothetical protein
MRRLQFVVGIGGLLIAGCQMAGSKESPARHGVGVTWAVRCAGWEPAEVSFDVTFARRRGEETTSFEPVGRGRPGAFQFQYRPRPVNLLPLWIPVDVRRVGGTVYDDGEGFKHNVGVMRFTLHAEEAWRGFEVLTLQHRYQGMQQDDNWTLQARYDRASGLLVTATVSTSSGLHDEPRASFEMVLVSSSDPTLAGKLLTARDK